MIVDFVYILGLEQYFVFLVYVKNSHSVVYVIFCKYYVDILEEENWKVVGFLTWHPPLNCYLQHKNTITDCEIILLN